VGQGMIFIHFFKKKNVVFSAVRRLICHKKTVLFLGSFGPFSPKKSSRGSHSPTYHMIFVMQGWILRSLIVQIPEMHFYIKGEMSHLSS
jgi:hypothetical protein